MALPPEPLADVLPSAALIIDATVTEVVSTGPAPNNPPVTPGMTSSGVKAPSQLVKLKVTRVIRGAVSVGQVLTVQKPEGGYSLRDGNVGPFMINASNVLLGRYGPDTYTFDQIDYALKKANQKPSL